MKTLRLIDFNSNLHRVVLKMPEDLYIFICNQCKLCMYNPSALVTISLEEYFRENNPIVMNKYIFDSRIERSTIPTTTGKTIRMDVNIKEDLYFKTKEFVQELNQPYYLRERKVKMSIPKVVIQAICQTFKYIPN